MLLKSWMDGTTHWRQLTDEEFIEEDNDRDEVENDVNPKLHDTGSVLQVRPSIDAAPVSSGAGYTSLEISLQASPCGSQPTVGDMSFNGTGALSLTQELRAALGTPDDNFSQAFPAHSSMNDASVYDFDPMDLSNNSLLPPGYIPPSSF